MEKRYAIVTIAVFALIVGGLSIANFFHTPPNILTAERRVRERRPHLSIEIVLRGEFMGGFETYAADTFPFREHFRAMRAAMVYGVFLQTDKDGVFFNADGIGSFQETNADSARLLAEKIYIVAETLPQMNFFLGVIPDKSMYATRNFPGFCAYTAEEILAARLVTLPNSYSSGFTMLPISSALSAGSFYRTDLHWCQVSINDVVSLMGDYMDFAADMTQFTRQYAGQFRGGYAGQFALPVSSDSMYYLYNPHLRAFYMNMATREFEENLVYDLALFHGFDPFDIFLRGVQPLVILENEYAVSSRELYIFRDSFSSSLAPILASYYARIVLVDFRFIDLQTLHTLIDFTVGADVLFLYSAGIINNSEVLAIYQQRSS